MPFLLSKNATRLYLLHKREEVNLNFCLRNFLMLPNLKVAEYQGNKIIECRTFVDLFSFSVLRNERNQNNYREFTFDYMLIECDQDESTTHFSSRVSMNVPQMVTSLMESRVKAFEIKTNDNFSKITYEVIERTNSETNQKEREVYIVSTPVLEIFDYKVVWNEEEKRQ